MSLRTVFKELYAAAEARATAERPGEALRVLRQGAQVIVRAQGRRRQVILSRHRVYVSDIEITTFREHGDIPAHATLERYASRDGRRHVALSWETPATLWELGDA